MRKEYPYDQKVYSIIYEFRGHRKCSPNFPLNLAQNKP